MKNVVITESSDHSHFLTRYYNFVTIPTLLYKNNHKVCNFDFALNIDDQDLSVNRICNIANKPIIGVERFDKSFQTALLQNGGIKTPETVKFFKGKGTIVSYTNIQELLSYFNDDDLIVVKAENGACGVRQALGKKESILNLIIDGKTENIRFGNLDKDKESTKIKKSDTYKNLNDNTEVLFQKFIKNTTEFRIIYFYDEPFIIIKRNNDENGSWQKNNQVTKNTELITSHSLITKDVENTLRTFFDKLNSPFFAVDLYFDHDNNSWGVYEFQMQFGTKKIPIETMIERSYNSIEKLIKKY